MKIKIYTSPGCFYCTQLKELLRRADLEYEQQIIEGAILMEQFKIDFPEVKGFPYVIIDDEGIGGLIETARLLVQKGLVSSGKK